MAKFLDLNGLETFLAKVKDWVNTLVNSTKSSLQSSINNKVDKTTTVNGHALSGNVTVTKSDVSLGNVTNDAQVKRSEMGQANGVATLNSSGMIPSTQLPSYVDDVLEYDNKSAFPASGEAGKIYVAKDTNLTYRWSGSAYVEISPSLALGETSSTAYPGDKGAENRVVINSLPDAVMSVLDIGGRNPDNIPIRVLKYLKYGMSYGELDSSDSFSLPAATSQYAGLMTAAQCADFNELTGIANAGILYNELRASASSTAVTIECDIAERNDSSNWSPVIKSIEIPSASGVQAGVMSIAMFNKLQGIAEGANNYTLPVATTSVLGGIKVGTSLSITDEGVLSVESILNTDIDEICV